MVNSLPASAGDVGSVSGLGRVPGEGSGYPLRFSGRSHGQRSLGGDSPWGCRRVRHDLMTKQRQHVIDHTEA